MPLPLRSPNFDFLDARDASLFVYQHPNDEPAEVMLARLKAQTGGANGEKPRKGGRRGDAAL
ncbi:hypothetical protein BE20_22610 [Sorangium cellulosum]|uniref:Uncharacterized protein n=1 Tax=Sorangium cellulosum TaxID=56 RepID=A0A150S7Y1_SORCE|nr:hypothetical protein BE20_22610 [Sorangium cellulosum]KYF97227.1 hypothetical protein BE18_23435 [Sorangium cellulosum]